MSKNSLALYKYTDEQVDLIKRTIAKDTTDNELELFLYTAQRLGLDPLAKQIYCLKMRGQMVPLTGIDGYRCVADRTGQYAPGRETVFTHDDKGNLISATAFVKKQSGDGTWHEVSATAYLKEYKGKTPIWQQMPHVMLEKCAEARALRRCFPSQLSGIYTREEMEQAETQPIVATPAKVTKKKVAKKNDVLDELLKLKRDIKHLVMDTSKETGHDPQDIWWDFVKQVLGQKYCPNEKQTEAQALERWDVACVHKLRKALL